MATLYSENEREFFKKILLDFELRIDGREKLTVRQYDAQPDILPSCFSSLRISYGGDKQITFAVKAETVNCTPDNITANSLYSISIDSMNRIDDLKLKKEMENYLCHLILSKLPCIKITEECYWKIYIDIILFDTLKLSLLQLLAIGLKEVINNTKLPDLIVFKNDITGDTEYDIKEGYEDLSDKEKLHSLGYISIPNVYVFAVINNNLYLDPTEEECSVANSIIIASYSDEGVISIQSVGSNVDMNKFTEITELVKSLK
jgi:exosome complex RNA-binding protein Rrp42 (RNase PH superfamily)